MTFGERIRLPTAERPVEIELPAVLNITAYTRLDVSQPVARHVNTSSDSSNRHPRRDQDPPYLTRVCEYLQLPDPPRIVSRKLP